MRKRDTTLSNELAARLQPFEQHCRAAAQDFYDELCRVSQGRAALQGVELGSFVVPRVCRTKQEQRRNLLVVVGFGPVVYNGFHNFLLQYAPDGTWTALLRVVSPSGHYTRDHNVYRWYSHYWSYQLHPGHKNVKPVHLKVSPAFNEEQS